MIQKFEQFINESTSGAQNPLSHSDKINDAYSAFLTRAEDRFNMMRDKITEILDAMDKAVQTTVDEFGDIIVGAHRSLLHMTCQISKLNSIQPSLTTTKCGKQMIAPH